MAFCSPIVQTYDDHEIEIIEKEEVEVDLIEISDDDDNEGKVQVKQEYTSFIKKEKTPEATVTTARGYTMPQLSLKCLHTNENDAESSDEEDSKESVLSSLESMDTDDQAGHPNLAPIIVKTEPVLTYLKRAVTDADAFSVPGVTVISSANSLPIHIVKKRNSTDALPASEVTEKSATNTLPIYEVAETGLANILYLRKALEKNSTNTLPTQGVADKNLTNTLPAQEVTDKNLTKTLPIQGITDKNLTKTLPTQGITEKSSTNAFPAHDVTEKSSTNTLPTRRITEESSANTLSISKSWEGPYGFRAQFVEESQIRKNESPSFCKINQKLYLNRDKAFRIALTTKPVQLPPNATVRAYCVFTSPTHAYQIVKPCPTHFYENAARGCLVPDHMVQCLCKDAKYEKNPTTGVYSVVMPFEVSSCDSDDSDEIMYVYKVMCFSSCFGGFDRKQTMLVFALEVGGKQMGRHSFEVKVCACPGRDRRTDMMKLAQEADDNDSDTSTPNNVTGNQTTQRYTIKVKDPEEFEFLKQMKFFYELKSDIKLAEKLVPK